jgi:hypothetical protein
MPARSLFAVTCSLCMAPMWSNVGHDQEVDLLMSIFLRFSERCEKEAMEHDICIKVLSTERERVTVFASSATVYHSSQNSSMPTS